MTPAIFKAYDIRGIYPEEIDELAVYGIAQAYAKLLKPKRVVLGRDVRISGAVLWEAAAMGLTEHGVDVLDIGVVTTDMMYFATAHCKADGGLTISASHNPRQYNGLKLMRKGALPISGDTGIEEIKRLFLTGYKYIAEKKGVVKNLDIRADYLKKCLSFVNVSKIKPLTVVVNGMSGPVVQNIRALDLPIKIIPLNDEPNGAFPKGPPDPLLEENRHETIMLVRSSNADLGAAWDGDADRFFLFDETGRFVPGYYITAFLGAHFAAQHEGAKVIHDPRLTWATQDAVRAVGGVPLENRVGHSFIKERMRKEDAVFAGEMSGHFYFRDYYYADNGLIPFLTLLQLISESGKKVSELFAPYFEHYYISGEVNLALSETADVPGILRFLEKTYSDGKVEKLDGLSFSYPDWRANIRSSNTEPLLRINVEAKSQAILDREFKRLKDRITTHLIS